MFDIIQTGFLRCDRFFKMCKIPVTSYHELYENILNDVNRPSTQNLRYRLSRAAFYMMVYQKGAFSVGLVFVNK